MKQNSVNKLNNKVNQISNAVTNINKKINKNNNNKVKRRVRRDRLPGNPINFRSVDKSIIIKLLEDYHRITRARYLFAMIHPDVAVTQGYQVKLYSDVPVPSSSIGFKSTYQLATSENGTFCLSWSPNFLSTSEQLNTDFPNNLSKLYSNVAYDNSSALTGSSPDNNFNYKPCYTPDIKLQKYRLVSALIKVKYNGSVLNQSGTMYSCATFDQLQVASGDLSADSNTAASRFGDFSLIRNGLWNRSVNITSDADGIECLYVPMDPTDITFYPIGDYYGLGIDKKVGSGNSLMLKQQSTEGAHVNYVIAGQNLPTNSSCIYVEVFSNFEVIADPQSAPVIRSSIESALSRTDNQLVTDLTANMTKSGMLIRTSKPNTDWSSRISDFVRKTYRVGKTLWPIISKAFL